MLLESGLDWLEQRTGKPVLGVLPYLHGLMLDAEDAVALRGVHHVALLGRQGQHPGTQRGQHRLGQGDLTPIHTPDVRPKHDMCQGSSKSPQFGSSKIPHPG